jgi:hypothetical protein
MPSSTLDPMLMGFLSRPTPATSPRLYSAPPSGRCSKMIRTCSSPHCHAGRPHTASTRGVGAVQEVLAAGQPTIETVDDLAV